MKLTVVKIATTVWLVGLVFSGLLLSIPPARVPIFLGLAGIACIPLALGPRRFHIFGRVAVFVSLGLTLWEHEAGVRETAQRGKMLRLIRPQAAQTSTTTNASPATHE